MGEVIGGNYVSTYSGDQIDGILGKANTYPAATAQDAGKVPVVQDDGTIDWGEGGGSDANLAPVESTSTAAQAYAVNSFLIYGGQLYRVTAAITQGDTLTVGTNIEAADAGTYLAMVAAADANYFDPGSYYRGVAPGGYGLGKNQGPQTNDTADSPYHIDNAIYPGWYLYTGSTASIDASLPSSTGLSVRAGLRVDSGYSTSIVRQTIHFGQIGTGSSAYYDYTLTRVRKRSTWQPWEWVNPPLVVDTEYRTTERYNEKPVYIKSYSVAANDTGNTDINRTDIAANASTIVDYHVYHRNWNALAPFTIADTGTTVTASMYRVSTTNYIRISVTGGTLSSSNREFRVVVKYTKTTD